jgi:hypothetical protein
MRLVSEIVKSTKTCEGGEEREEKKGWWMGGGVEMGEAEAGHRDGGSKQ